VLLLRVGNASKKRRFALGQWIDRVSMALRGGGFIPLAGRPPEQWAETLRNLGFDVELVPMNGRPPFSNFPADRARARRHAGMTPLAISAYTLTTALGTGREATLDALRPSAPASSPGHFLDVELPTWIGEVAALANARCRPISPTSTAATTGWPGSASSRTASPTRCWRRASAGARTASRCCSAPHRRAARDRARLPPARAGRRPARGRALPRSQNTYSVGAFVTRAFDLRGPSWVVSTACSSSAKVYASAARLIAAGLVDAAIVGGVDSLCLTTLVRLQLARAAVVRDLPAVGRAAARPVDRRGGRVRAARARRERRRTAGCSASARATTAIT
jgi:hypothetical protein